MTEIQQENEQTYRHSHAYPLTSTCSTTVRLARVWVDYAEANGMPLQQRIGEDSRYVWFKQTPHQWYTAMLHVHWYIVGHGTGWNNRHTASTGQVVAAAKRAYRQLIRQSPIEWREWLRDGSMGEENEPVSVCESYTTWHVKFSGEHPTQDTVTCPYMPVLSDPLTVLHEAVAIRGVPMAYDPIRDEDGDDCWGLMWRVWCVDPSIRGWMSEYTAQVVPFITLLYHREETVCRQEGCGLCGGDLSSLAEL